MQETESAFDLHAPLHPPSSDERREEISRGGPVAGFFARLKGLLPGGRRKQESPEDGDGAPAPVERSLDVPTEEDVLGIHHLGKSYKGRRVIEDVSLYLRRGEVVGLLGPNGAGKTTLFYMITGLIRPDAGLIELDGHDVTMLPMYRRARLGIGYLPQEPSIFRGLSVEDNIRAVLEIAQPAQLTEPGLAVPDRGVATLAADQAHARLHDGEQEDVEQDAGLQASHQRRCHYQASSTRHL